MQTHFSETQLAKPEIARANDILRSCVHCGFCLSTCPTYTVLGDERDSPRGRIYLIKDMLENERAADAAVTRHLDRCLSCLSCMTTCPSGVDYMHLIDFARGHVEATGARTRSAVERLLRAVLGVVLPRPTLFRAVMMAARGPAMMAPLFGRRLGAILALARAPSHGPSWTERPQVIPAKGTRRKRVALLLGCVQRALAPEINEATVRLLTRHGCEVVVPRGLGCCGALSHHLGRTEEAERWATASVAALAGLIDGEGLDAIVVNASGCGTVLKDYGVVLAHTPAAAAAARVVGRVRDVSELMEELGLEPTGTAPACSVAYHAACSLQHGQKIDAAPRRLLEAAGFDVRAVPDGHLCCGSAGTYNLLQPALAGELRRRKVETIARTGAEVVAAGNVGCIVQIAGGTDRAVMHTVELLDWATGGPLPPALRGRIEEAAPS